MLPVFLLPLKSVAGNWKEKVKKIDWPGVEASVTSIVLLLVRLKSQKKILNLGEG